MGHDMKFRCMHTQGGHDSFNTIVVINLLAPELFF